MQAAASRRPRRRWLQFGLRSLLLATTIFGVWLGIHMKRVRRQKEAVQAIREFGGCVHYDFQVTAKPPYFDASIEPPIPRSLVDLLGVDFFFDVAEVNLVYNEDAGRREDNSEVTDGALRHLAAFPKLRQLLLKNSQVTDDGLRIVGRLKRLTSLYMWDASEVTDAGISHLADLSGIKVIYLSNSQIGDESLKVFARLPRLEELTVYGNRFTDRGLAYLQDCGALRQLCIGGGQSSITDAGMPSIGRISTLEILDIQKTHVTDHGLEQLAGLKRLTYLSLFGTQAQGATLHQALPKCAIHR